MEFEELDKEFQKIKALSDEVFDEWPEIKSSSG